MHRWIAVVALTLLAMFGVAASPAWADEPRFTAAPISAPEQIAQKLKEAGEIFQRSEPRQRDAQHVTIPAPREIVSGWEWALRKLEVAGR